LHSQQVTGGAGTTKIRVRAKDVLLLPSNSSVRQSSPQAGASRRGSPPDSGSGVNKPTAQTRRPGVAVALLTGGSDKPYAFGLATSLLSQGATIDLIGSSEIDCTEFHTNPNLTLFLLRGSLRRDAAFIDKALRISSYYAKLVAYSAFARPQLFHILWNNRFEVFDRTALMSFYRALGKKVVLTAHNVNLRKRDSKDSTLNRLTLRIQYRLANHIFVHTEQMRRELIEEFGVPEKRITTVPFGINNAVPNTGLTSAEARQRLGIRETEKAILFFGRIKPYKGIEYLIDAFRRLLRTRQNYRLIIAGRADTGDSYWTSLLNEVRDCTQRGSAIIIPEFIPDRETEVYFKAADVLVLPYRRIYQSGVLFLGFSFGLPALVADVGSLRDEIVEGQNGFVFKPEDPVALADAVERYFGSDLYADLDRRRSDIKSHANQRHSWEDVARTTMNVYAKLLRVSLRAT
jgi:D-inositol-3-phosphate glycosyltransferase